MTSANRRKRSLPILGLLAILVLILLGLSLRPAIAAGIVVNSAADTATNDGECTLREAIDNANSDSDTTSGDCTAGSGTDTITFADDYTITLVGSQLPKVTSEISITGNGPANTIIQANADPDTATYRVFEVGSTGVLTLDSVTVRHGRCTRSCSTSINDGGGILNQGTLTVSDSTLSDNSTDSAVSFGGGIYNANGTATVINSTLSGNFADFGGGGVYNENGTLIVTDSTLSGNSAAVVGGGIYNFGGTLTMTNSTLTGNDAVEAGGGIINNDGTAIVTDSTLSGNSASFSPGGGILNQGTLIVTNSTLSDNSATNSHGGGIYNEDGTATVTNSTLSGNVANSGGGIGNNDGTVTVTNSTLSDNSATFDGGGIYNFGGTLTMTNSTLSGNSAGDEGGGIRNNSGGTLTVTNSLLVKGSSGANCSDLSMDASNIADDGSCGSATQKLTAEINLGPLADNGGPTLTHALLPGSAAIDFNASASCAAAPVDGLDQRGQPRNVEISGEGNDGGPDLCDTGAFEVQLPATSTIYLPVMVGD